MFVNGKHLMKVIEQHFPKHLAESWDNVGFLVGSPNGRVEKVMTALELTPLVLEEAIEKNVDLIVTHHPLIFKALKKVTDESETGELVKKLIQHKIGLYSAHTNLDSGRNGTGNYFGEAFELKGCKPIETNFITPYVKLVTYVPKDHAQVVADAIALSGGGQLGNYDNCHFIIEGKGTFRPLAGASPFIGEIGETEIVEEVRVETIVPKALIKQVVGELIKVHPYEVPAYDILALENEMDAFGIGVVGSIEEALSFEALVEKVKTIFGVSVVRAVKSMAHPIRKIAICPGAGAEYIVQVASMGCEVFITGDLKYHEAQLARSLRLSVIDVGHYESEAPYMVYFAKWLQEECDKKDYEVKIIYSEVNANPIQTYF